MSVRNLCKSQCGSNYWVHALAAADAPEVLLRADLVLVETSTNDVYETLHDASLRFGDDAASHTNASSRAELQIRAGLSCSRAACSRCPARPS